MSWAYASGRAENDPDVDQERIGTVTVMTDGVTAAAVCAGRAQRVQTIASSQAKVATQWAELEQARARRPHIIAALSGSAGLVIGAATLVPRLVHYDYLWIVSVFSLALLAVPLGCALFVLWRMGPVAESEFVVLAGRSRSMAMLGDRMTRVVEKLRGRDGLEPPHRQCLDLVLLDIETEIEAVAKTMRGKEHAGRGLRRDQRIVPRHRKVVVRAADGRRLHGTIVDLSVSGVALTEALPRLLAGHEVTIGSRPARVARVWENGIAFTFKTPLDVSTFDEHVVL